MTEETISNIQFYAMTQALNSIDVDINELLAYLNLTRSQYIAVLNYLEDATNE
jgi:hypothetical protein